MLSNVRAGERVRGKEERHTQHKHATRTPHTPQQEAKQATGVRCFRFVLAAPFCPPQPAQQFVVDRHTKPERNEEDLIMIPNNFLQHGEKKEKREERQDGSEEEEHTRQSTQQGGCGVVVDGTRGLEWMWSRERRLVHSLKSQGGPERGRKSGQGLEVRDGVREDSHHQQNQTHMDRTSCMCLCLCVCVRVWLGRTHWRVCLAMRWGCLLTAGCL